MRYLCMIYGDDEVFAALSRSEQDALVDDHLDYDEQLLKRGRLIAAEALQEPATAKVVEMRNGIISATDGPFAETKEQFGGFYLIDADSLEEAIEMAGHIPSARHGSVEVRPVRDLTVEVAARTARDEGGG